MDEETRLRFNQIDKRLNEIMEELDEISSIIVILNQDKLNKI